MLTALALVSWGSHHLKSKETEQVTTTETVQPALVAQTENETLHPLLIDLILDKVFENLDLVDLKYCRLVCLKWEEVSQALFMWKSNVVIAGKSTTGPNLEKKDHSSEFKRFAQVFSHPFASPFRKFGFSGAFDGDDINSFIKSRENIRKLVLHQFCALTNSGEPKDWTWKWNKYQLNHFEYDSHGYSHLISNVTIFLSVFPKTETIILRGSDKLSVVFDAKISPINFSLRGTPKIWITNREDPLDFSLNECIHTELLKTLTFSITTRTRLDLTQCQKLDTLRFECGTGGSLTGWNPNLNITELTLKDLQIDSKLLPKSLKTLKVEFDFQHSGSDKVDLIYLPRLEILEVICGNVVGSRNQKYLKKLKIMNFHIALDISLLPESLENLYIEGFDDAEITCSAPCDLPNLKYFLYIGDASRIPQQLYPGCPVLNTLTLYAARSRLDVSLLPKTMKQITVDGHVKIVGTGSVSVEKVVVDSFDSVTQWKTVDKVLEKLNPKVIVVMADFVTRTKVIVKEKVFVRVLRSVRKQMVRGGIFVLSHVTWLESDLISVKDKRNIRKSCHLAPSLMEHHYVFENYRGEIVQGPEFVKWMDSPFV